MMGDKYKNDVFISWLGSIKPLLLISTSRLRVKEVYPYEYF